MTEVMTRAARRAHGKLLRATCPRASHAQWMPRSADSDPVAWLESSNAGRIPGLIPIRYGRMAQSALHFFRGTAIVQARDLAGSPASGIDVQLCGDCHLSNFGGFATPERALAFDINDFDETFPGPWEWDLKRLVASLVLAARYRSFSAPQAGDAVRAAVKSYRKRMSAYADLGVLEMWYTQIKLEDLLDHFKGEEEFVERLVRAGNRARKNTSESVFPKLTEVADGAVHIVENPPLIYHFHQDLENYEDGRAEAFARYVQTLSPDLQQLCARYRFADSALKVVGVGSVGTRCFIELHLADGLDPLFLQIKEARRSVLEPGDGPSRYAHQGERVVTGQRLMQSASDIFLGWGTMGKHDAYVRQLRDMKVSAEIEALTPALLTGYAEMCGWALARAHAKAGDAAAIAGYVGGGSNLDDALVLYATAYADQAERDFESFQRAIRSGRLKTDATTSADDLRVTFT